MKALALSCSPLNVLGRFPIAFKSVGTGIGTRWLGGITSPCPGSPSSPGGLPPPPPEPPPGEPPLPGPVLWRAVAKAVLSHSPALGAAGAAGGDPEGAVEVVGVDGAVGVVSLGAIVVAGAIVVVPIILVNVIW